MILISSSSTFQSNKGNFELDHSINYSALIIYLPVGMIMPGHAVSVLSSVAYR